MPVRPAVAVALSLVRYGIPDILTVLKRPPNIADIGSAFCGFGGYARWVAMALSYAV